MTHPLFAREGRVYFLNGHSIKGDVQYQTDAEGREVIVLGLESGSLTLQTSEVKKVVFTGTPSRRQKSFHAALRNTPAKTPVSAKVPTPYEEVIRAASDRHRLDPALVKAVIKQESNFNRRDVSHKGAEGLMQLMPQTAKGLGVKDSFDPHENIHGGTRYLRYMLDEFGGDVRKALAAYNAGPYAVKKYGTIPPYRETQGYVRNVLYYYQSYQGNRLHAFKDRKGSLVITDRPYLP